MLLCGLIIMYKSTELSLDQEGIQLRTSKIVGKWGYVKTDKSVCETLQTKTDDKDTDKSFDVRASDSCKDKICCEFLQVQSTKCDSRAVPAHKYDLSFENAYIRSKGPAYFRECAVCDDCLCTRAKILQRQDEITESMPLWQYSRLISSLQRDDKGNEVIDANSWYIMNCEAKDRLRKTGMTETQAIAQYAQEHGGFTHADFLNAGFDFLKDRRILPNFDMVSLDMKFHATNIEHAFHKYIHDYNYSMRCKKFMERRAMAQQNADFHYEDLASLACLPYTSYEYAFESAVSILSKYKDEFTFGQSGVGPFMFGSIITGIRNYLGYITACIVYLEANNSDVHTVGDRLRADILSKICTGKVGTKTVCLSHISLTDKDVNFKVGDLRLFRISCIQDYETLGEVLVSSLLIRYAWVADIADLWVNAHETCTLLKDEYKKYIVKSRRLADCAIVEWCARLLDSEGVVIRPSETGTTIGGTICSTCIVSNDHTNAHCHLTSAIVYFSERNLCALKKYLARLRNICSEMSTIGAHVRDTLCRKCPSYYDDKAEKKLVPQKDIALLQEEAKSIWDELCATNTDITVYGYRDMRAYMYMIKNIRDRQYSFLYTHSISSSTFYTMLTTNNILLSVDRDFKSAHYDRFVNSSNRYLFSMGILMFNADDCDDECLYKLHTSNNIILGNGASSHNVLDGIEQPDPKSAKRAKTASVYISEVLCYMNQIKLTHIVTCKQKIHTSKCVAQMYAHPFSSLKVLCAKFHCKYSSVYFEARFNDSDPIRLYDQNRSINIWHISSKPDHQYIYHKAHMFRVYVFGAFTDRLHKYAERYEQDRQSRTHTKPYHIATRGVRDEDKVQLNQCSNCTQNIITVNYNSAMGDYINAHIAKVLPAIMSFYKFRSFSNTTPSALDKRLHPNLLNVKACDSTVEFLYHEDPARIAEIYSQMHESTISSRAIETILRDEKFYMIVMESDNTVFGAASTSVRSMCEDIDTCYYDRPPVKHDGRNITISRACHSKKDTQAFYAKHVYDFIECRDKGLLKTIEQRKLSIETAISQQTQEHKEHTEDSETHIREKIYRSVLDNIQEDNEDSCDEEEKDNISDEAYMNISTQNDEHSQQNDVQESENTQEDNTHTQTDSQNDVQENETCVLSEHVAPQNKTTHKTNVTTDKKLVRNVNAQNMHSVFDKCSGAKRFMKTHHSLISAGKLIGSRRKIDKPLRARRSLSRESRSAREGGYESDGYESCSEKSSVYRARSVSKNRRRVKEEPTEKKHNDKEKKHNDKKQKESFDLENAIQTELNRRAQNEAREQKRKEEEALEKLKKTDSKGLRKYKKEQKKQRQKNKRK